ncbi:MAG TPA: phage portal protein, partial [Candidatus Thermoplasmatota archaeon]|nr:phage portal protein [Candidatus Thermoplasmatota archaeon]
MGRLRDFFTRSRGRGYGVVSKDTGLAPAGSPADVRAFGVDPWTSVVSQGRGILRPFNTTLLRRLSMSEAVGMCMDTIVDDVTSVDWTITNRKDGKRAPPADIDRVAAFLDDANPNYTTFRDTLEATLADMLSIGNGVWVKSFTRGGKLAQFAAYDAETFFLDADEHGIITGFHQYSRTMGGESVRFEPEEVAWFTYGARTYRHYGSSPVERLNERLQLLAYTIQQETAYFKEGSIPSGLLSFAPEWDKNDVDAFMAYWQANVKGKPHKMPYAHGKVEYVPFGYNYQELQFLERQAWYTKLVCATFKVPPAYLGLAAETTNRATDVSQMSNYKRKAIRPLLLRLEQVINQSLIWPHVSHELAFRFQPSLDLAERQILTSIREAEVRSGLRTINEIRSEDG